MSHTETHFLVFKFEVNLPLNSSEVQFMKFYMVNTNRKLNPNGSDEKQMFDEQIVSLYHDKHKHKIDLLKDGDIVFFYSNGNGVIGCGQVSGKTFKRSYQNLENAEYYKKLKFITKLSDPITVTQMKKLFGKRQPTLRSFIPMSKEKGIKLYNFIHSIETIKAA